MKALAIILLTLFGTAATAQIGTPQRPFDNRPFFQNRPNHNGLMINQRRPSFSAALQVGIPAGDYAENYQGTPVGFGGGMYFNMRQTPFDFGITGAWRSAGRHEERVILYTGDDLLGNPTFGSGTINVNNNQSNVQAAMRFRPFAGKFQLYGEALAGMKSFSSKTTVESEKSGFTEVSSEDKTLQSSALSYGWAAGAKYLLTRGLMAEVRFENMMGGTNQYMDLNSITMPANGQIEYNTFKSKTDMYLLNFGISIEF